MEKEKHVCGVFMGGGGVCVEKIKYACAPAFVPSGWMHIIILFC